MAELNLSGTYVIRVITCEDFRHASNESICLQAVYYSEALGLQEISGYAIGLNCRCERGKIIIQSRDYILWNQL
jgi:hypothetical protein